MGREYPRLRRSIASGATVSRRAILRNAAGAATVGVAGGGTLAESAATPAMAASQAATVEQGALAPAVVHLTDAPTVVVDASLGNDFRLTIAGNRTMSSPANPTSGQQIILQLTQGPDGPFTVTWSDGYQFSFALPQPTLSTTAGQTDLLGFVYNAAKGAWLLTAFLNGFG